jgi:hypothetical protein
VVPPDGDDGRIRGLPVTTVEGRIIAIGVMLAGIGFISVLTATVAAKFVETDTNSDEMLEAIRRIEADVSELKTRLPAA